MNLALMQKLERYKTIRTDNCLVHVTESQLFPGEVLS